MDKQFIVAFAVGRSPEHPPILAILGHEFIGLEASRARPQYLIVPVPSGDSMGAWVEHLLIWSFDPLHELKYADGPTSFL
jgi:hypothetical protein